EVFDDRETEPEATLSARARAVCLPETFEEPIDRLRRHSDAGVGNRHRHSSLVAIEPQPYGTPRGCELDSVADHVYGYLNEAVLIAHHEHSRRRGLEQQGHSLLVGGGS